jgi:hypothetical protein
MKNFVYQTYSAIHPMVHSRLKLKGILYGKTEVNKAQNQPVLVQRLWYMRGILPEKGSGI